MGTKLRLQVRSARGVSAEGGAGEPRGAGDAGRPGAPGALSGAAYLRQGRPHALPGAARGGRGAEPGDLQRVPRGRAGLPGAWGLGRRWRLGKKSQRRSRRGLRAERGPGLGARRRSRRVPQTPEEPESVGGKGCLISFGLPTPPPPLLRTCPPSPPPPSPSQRPVWALGRRET